MDIIYSLILRLIHSIYALCLFVFSLYQQHHWKPPQPLTVARQRIPKHLALVLKTSSSHSRESTVSALVQSVANAASWCRELGIERLTVYEENGLLTEYDQDIRSQLLRTNPATTVDSDSSESEVEYQPLTPPPSDYSDSRPISPSQTSRPVIPSINIVLSDITVPKNRSSKISGLRRRNRGQEHESKETTLTVCLISKDASKNAIAAAATLMAQNHKSLRRKSSRSRKPFSLNVEDFESVLEGDQGLPPPDFMIVHSLDPRHAQTKVPLEFYNFPPWQIRLTEIHLSRLAHVATQLTSQNPYPLDEIIFREALDEYAGAEFRFGK